MPGSLLQGYLKAQAHTQQQEELEEQRKMDKLNKALQELQFKQISRKIAKDVEEQKYQERKRAETEEAILQLPEEARPYIRLGLKLPEAEITKEKEPWWIGKPYEEQYRRKETYIKPETETGGLKMGTIPIAKGWGYNPATEQVEKSEEEQAPEDLLKMAEQFEFTEGLEGLGDSLKNLAAEGLRGKYFPKISLPGRQYEKPAGPERPEETKPINYEAMAKTLKDSYGIKFQSTLEGYKNELSEHYPGLDWEKLKSYFK